MRNTGHDTEDSVYDSFIRNIQEAGADLAGSPESCEATEDAVIGKIRKSGDRKPLKIILSLAASAAAVLAIALLMPEDGFVAGRGRTGEAPGYAELGLRAADRPDAQEKPRLYTAYKNSKALKERIMRKALVQDTDITDH